MMRTLDDLARNPRALLTLEQVATLTGLLPSKVLPGRINANSRSRCCCRTAHKNGSKPKSARGCSRKA